MPILPLVLLLLACAQLLTGPPTEEVRAVLPIPASVALDDAECVGQPGTSGYLCTLHGESPLSMEEGAAAAAAMMAGWEEGTWDWVPGRIQWGWSRGEERVGIAVHEQPGGSIWSIHYARSSDAPPPTYPTPQERPGAAVPAALATLPVPAGARLLDATEQPDNALAEAWWSLPPGSLDALDPFPPPGTAPTLRSRSPRSRSIQWTDGRLEYGVFLLQREGDAAYMLSVHRAR